MDEFNVMALILFCILLSLAFVFGVVAVVIGARVAYNRKHRMTPQERIAYENRPEAALVTEKVERR